jgi:riboflavin kinase/FMN adenylyltransferase
VRVLQRIDELNALPGLLFVTVGTFDGVHSGHRAVLSALIEVAEERGGAAWAVTFEPHPQEFLRPQDAPPILTTWEEKRQELARVGLHGVLLLPFDAALARQPGEAFLQDLLAGRASGEAGIVVGHDTRLGRGRAVGVQEIRALAEEKGWEFQLVQEVGAGERPVKSTRIRHLLLAGQVREAARLLGRPYSLAGNVVSGAGRGAGLGYPTANLEDPPGRKLVPGDGVYAAWAEVAREGHRAAVSVGTRPTYGDGPRVIEVHLLDLERDLRGERLRLHFVQRIRGQERFPDEETLRAAMADDCRRVRESLDAAASGPPFSWYPENGPASMGAYVPHPSEGR